MKLLWTGPLLALSLLGGCIDLPDMRRGQRALQVGDLQEAQNDFETLAQMGYPDAQQKLARVYAQQDNPEALEQAAYWYRQAMASDPALAVPLAKVLMRINKPESREEAEHLLETADVFGDPRSEIYLVELYASYPELDRAGRAPQLVEQVADFDNADAEAAVIGWYRANFAGAEYAKKLLSRCDKARKRVPECYVDLARNYRETGNKDALLSLSDEALRGYKSGRVPAPVLMKLGWSLVSDDVAGDPQPEKAYAMLKPVSDISPMAQTRLARVLIEYPQLDPDAKPEPLLLEAVKQGYPEAQLALGRLYMKGQSVPADPAKAAQYLEKAAATQPGANYYLGRMYKRGELGREDPVRAAKYLLTAARQGYVQADLALAQLYSDNRGVRVNRPNAYAFASIAAANAVPNSTELLAQLKPAMSAAETKQAQNVMQQELALRKASGIGASLARGAPASGARQ